MNNEDPRDIRIRELESLLAKALARIEELEAEVARLKQQLAKNSRNSGKPPSSDGPKKPKPKSSRIKGKRKSGGQPGHPGHTLKASKEIDHIEIIHAPSSCDCGQSLDKIKGFIGEVRQVHDIPVIRKIEVTEHRQEHKRCPRCQNLSRADFPQCAKSSVAYGPQLRAFAAYCRIYQLIPSARTCELIEDIFGIRISEGTLANILEDLDNKIAPSIKAIADTLQGSSILHADETGVRIKGQRKWLHVACNQMLTHYAVHSKRGAEATDEIGILPQFRGRLIHDYWHPYFRYTACEHGLCNVHHLRDLTFVHEELGKDWAKQMHACLLSMNHIANTARSLGQNRLPKRILETLMRRYREIIKAGYREEPIPKRPEGKKRGRPKKGRSYNLIERFDLQRHLVLAFLFNLKVPFGNNQGERDLRMAKAQQKVSGTFRSWGGASLFCSIRSYISTARKHGLKAMDALIGALDENLFMPLPM